MPSGVVASRTRRWRGTAFGLGIDADTPIPGIAEGGVDCPRSVGWRRASEDELGRLWCTRGSRPLVDRRYDDGRVFLRVEHHPELGYRIAAPRYGTHLVSADGARIDSAISPETRRWQRLFFAQALPLAAATSGLGLLHASAVEIDGVAFAFVAPSGTGKTSLAVHLVGNGACLVSDDVLALEPRGSSVRVHPGAATVSLAPHELAALSPRGRARFARGCWGSADRKLQLDAVTARRPLTLCGVFFLRRDAHARAVAVERERSVPATRLLASAFLPHVDTPDRLKAQLAVCATLAASVPIFGIAIPPAGSARETAEVVLEFGSKERLWA